MWKENRRVGLNERRVPLLIKLPHAVGKRIENRVELVDILPTLLQAARIEIPKKVQGESLLPLMQARVAGGSQTVDVWRDRAAYAQSDVPRIEFGRSGERSLRTGKYLYIQSPRRELYDQKADPKADHDLASSSAALADTLASQLGFPAEDDQPTGGFTGCHGSNGTGETEGAGIHGIGQ
jgi:arylsulfatase A-like enzyme